MSFLSVHDSLPYVDREHGRDRCKSITCDGKPLQVTQTLFSAHLQLRRIIMSKNQAGEHGMTYLETLPVPRSKHIWIDQVCIDQQNLDERSAQIPLMNKIFASAQYVFAWIGDIDSLGLDGFNVAIARGRDQVFGIQQSAGNISYETIGKVRKDLYALTALLSRLWFRRAWVRRSKYDLHVGQTLTFYLHHVGDARSCLWTSNLPLVRPTLHGLVDPVLCAPDHRRGRCG